MTSLCIFLLVELFVIVTHGIDVASLTKSPDAQGTTETRSRMLTSEIAVTQKSSVFLGPTPPSEESTGQLTLILNPLFDELCKFMTANRLGVLNPLLADLRNFRTANVRLHPLLADLRNIKTAN
ncbi:hypothetical protein BaRGS_00024130, partial [Batillaria attramentaria]